MKASMNWTDRLARVKRAVFHTNGQGSPCPDGMAAAIIINAALPKIEIVFASYGAELDAIEVTEGLMFVDICPPVDKVDAFLEAGALVLDHHASRRADVERFAAAGQGYYGKNEHLESGAKLAYMHVWLIKPASGAWKAVERFAMTAAVRDTWAKDHPYWKASGEQAEVLRLYPWSHWQEVDAFSEDENGETEIDRAMEVGALLRARTLERAEGIAKQAVLAVTRRGTRIAMVNTTETSDVADFVDADVLIGFRYAQEARGTRMQLSFRSRADYDVGRLAKNLGGGGHVSASGANIQAFEDYDYDYPPTRDGFVARIIDIIEAYENEKG